MLSKTKGGGMTNSDTIEYFTQEYSATDKYRLIIRKAIKSSYIWVLK